MRIYGLQKLTLLDYPGKVACTVFTGGCNLRCPYCHNASLVIDLRESEAMSEETVFAFLQKRAGTLDGICVSGGEPLLQPGLSDFLRRVKSLGYAVKLDTNGSYPHLLKEVVSQSLVDYLAMDLKSSPKQYSMSVGLPDFDYVSIRESIDFLLSSSVEYEFRTTVAKGLHTPEILREAASEIRGAKRYFLQKFVDSGDLIGRGLSAFSDEEMKALLNIVSPYVQAAALRGV